MFHLKELSREESLRLVEEAREKAWKDQAAREDDSFNRGIEKGKAQGIEEGIKKGRTQGVEEGIEKGRTQGMEKGVKKGRTQGKKDLILSMLKNGLEISFISKITGFFGKRNQQIKGKPLLRTHLQFFNTAYFVEILFLFLGGHEHFSIMQLLF